MPTHLSVLLITLFLLMPVAALAQSSPVDTLPRLKVGRLVRVRTEDGQRQEGRFAASDSAAAWLHVARLPAPIRVESVDSLWVCGRAVKRRA